MLHIYIYIYIYCIYIGMLYSLWRRKQDFFNEESKKRFYWNCSSLLLAVSQWKGGVWSCHRSTCCIATVSYSQSNPPIERQRALVCLLTSALGFFSYNKFAVLSTSHGVRVKAHSRETGEKWKIVLKKSMHAINIVCYIMFLGQIIRGSTIFLVNWSMRRLLDTLRLRLRVLRVEFIIANQICLC